MPKYVIKQRYLHRPPKRTTVGISGVKIILMIPKVFEKNIDKGS